VKKMVADFAANLNAKLSGAAMPAAQSDTGGFFLGWIWSRIKAIFGGK